MAGAGDVNGDGFAIVGARFFDNGQSGEGAAFVYLGGAAGLATPPAWQAESDQANFGRSVAGAGDVNGDGFADVLGAPQFDNGQTIEGAAFVYLTRPAWRLRRPGRPKARLCPIRLFGGWRRRRQRRRLCRCDRRRHFVRQRPEQ